jgi:hypothetical protein
MKAKISAVLTLALIVLFCAGSADAQFFGRRKPKQTTWPCQDQQGFSSTTLTVVIIVKPTYNMSWKFPEAPSVVAQRILADLNENSRGITFQEANGVVPNLFINVTMSETNDGTQQDSAYAEVTGLGKSGTLFHESSGPAPFVGWRDAVDHLSSNMLGWLQNGWHTNAPCREADGSMRR